MIINQKQFAETWDTLIVQQYHKEIILRPLRDWAKQSEWAADGWFKFLVNIYKLMDIGKHDVSYLYIHVIHAFLHAHTLCNHSE